jgi:O-antigen/teichoic acid export membrane protein
VISSWKNTVKDFNSKAGFHLLGSSFLGKIARFLLSLAVIKILPPETFGQLSYALSILAFIAPFNGFGLQHSLVRFGAIAKNDLEKSAINQAILNRGLLAAICSSIALFLLASLVSFNLPGSTKMLQILSFQLVGLFVLEFVNGQLLLDKKNKKYASLNLVYNLVLLLFGVIFTYFLNEIGYLVVLLVVPLVVYAPFISWKGLFKRVKASNKNEWFKYGIYTGFAALASQLLFSIDTILIGNILKDPIQIALYRTGSILPLNLLFIPVTFMKADYVLLANNYKDKSYLVNYLKKYYSIFVPLTIGITGTGLFFSEEIISLIFGETYKLSAPIFSVLLVGVMGAYLLRAPFGGLLAAIGRTNYNAITAVTVLVLNIGFNYLFIPKYGIMAASIATASLLWLSGIMGMFFFFYLYRKS